MPKKGEWKMKKAIFMLMLSAILVGSASISLARGPSMGAVKTGLYERQDGDDPTGPGSGKLVGFAVVNTNCEGVLAANVVVNGLSEGTHDVYLKVNGRGHLVGTITVSKKERGQARVMWNVGIADEKGDMITVQVVVKQGAGGAVVGAATATVDLALKCPCDEIPE